MNREASVDDNTRERGHENPADGVSPPERLDLVMVVSLSQAISGELDLDKLTRTLLEIAVEQSGAGRGLLFLPEGAGYRAVAEATTAHGSTIVTCFDSPLPPPFPASVFAEVIHTQQIVGLDDALAADPFSTDGDVVARRVRSVLCLPLVKKDRIEGVLYLESTMATHVFTAARTEVLKLVALQAAISIENARLYENVQASEDRLRLAIDSIPAMVGSAQPDGTTDFINEHWQQFTGYSLAKTIADDWSSAIHPDDRPGMARAWVSSIGSGEPFEHEARTRRADGQYRWFLYRGLPLRDDHGRVVRWFAAGLDIDDQRRAEEQVRQDERELRMLVDFIPHLIGTLDAQGRQLHVNRAALEFFGSTLQEMMAIDDARERIYHHEDLELVRRTLSAAIEAKRAGEVEARMRRYDGQYRWFLIRYEPVDDGDGEISRWYVTGTDIQDRKQAEERVVEENLALREEIDKASMFEEIVGTSPPLRTVLSLVSKVAPTESTVLITGETGTGKELVARAIHRGSPRAPSAFISVNCAAIPSSLIASELFGHERGAFTGAIERRLGRFELAEGGTIFLDEVGELPAETQVALLHVLQERTFERVGGNRALPSNVRVIAATNRDLPAAIDAGSFRADLYYRLNVFPISMPLLHDRREDIPLLVSYFIDRYGRRAGKRIRGINKRSLERLKAYSWPGNIRELQNVIERSVIVADSDTLTVDERWLRVEPGRSAVRGEHPLDEAMSQQQKTMIEAALGETRGRVSGPTGAAAKLGMRSSTLESRIRALGIDKHLFRTRY